MTENIVTPPAVLAKAYRMVAEDLPGPTAPALLYRRAEELEREDAETKRDTAIGSDVLRWLNNQSNVETHGIHVGITVSGQTDFRAIGTALRGIVSKHTEPTTAPRRPY